MLVQVPRAVTPELSEDILLYRTGEAVVVNMWGDDVGLVLHRLGSIAHCYREADSREHVQVVLAVSKSARLLDGDSQIGQDHPYPRPFFAVPKGEMEGIRRRCEAMDRDGN